MMNLILRAIVCVRPSGFVKALSILIAMLILFVPKTALALDANDCFTHVENITIDDVRYLRITRADRKECDLYLIAKNFPQLGEDGKPLPIQKQLRSIKTANDAFMEGKRGVRPVHSHCVPDSNKPWSDQTDTEREMCPAQLVNYYPVTNEILVPRVPQLSKSEQIKELSSASCEALSIVPNPSDEVKKILAECQKHIAGITIPLPSVSPEREQLKQARDEVASLLATSSEQTQSIVMQKAHIASLAGSKRSWSGIAVFFLCAFGLATVVAIHSRRKQSKLQDLANIRLIEMEQRIAKAIEERAGGPSKEDYEAVMLEQINLRASLQRLTDEKTNLSQQLADSKQACESRVVEFTSVQDSLYMQVATLGAKRDELAQRVQISDKKFEEVQTRNDVLVKEHVELKAVTNSLHLQLSQLFDTEQRVRGEHLKNLSHSIDLAKQVIAQLDERCRASVANDEFQKAEAQAERMNALQQILVTTVGEYEARSLALRVLVENDPRNASPESFLRALIHDTDARTENLAYVVETNSTLNKLSTQLASDNTEALEQVAKLREENSELLEQWCQLVTGIARGLKLDLKALNELNREEQSEQLALGISEMKAQRLADSDLQEQVTVLQEQRSDLKRHNAALRQAIDADEPRKQMATLIYATTASEAEVAKMGRLVDKSREELKIERDSKVRLQEAVRAQNSAGLFALEAPELAVLPTQRLMQFLQTCILAVHQKPNASADAEVVLVTDADLGALNSFLRLPLVSENGFRLPPSLRMNMGPLQVYHVVDEACRREPVAMVRTPSTTPTIAPKAMEKPAPDPRKQTMQGLGTVSDRDMTVPYPSRIPEFDLSQDSDEEGKPTH